MKRINLVLVMLAGLSAMLVPSISRATVNDNVIRCNNDQLNKWDAIGRNAWARKCGKLSRSLELAFNEEENYVIFQRAYAPFHEDEPCTDDFGPRVGSCVAMGCYTPDQKLRFGVSDIEIEKAFTNGLTSISALDSIAPDFASVRMKDTPLQNFVVGDASEWVYTIQLANGNRVSVTETHPLVNELFEILPAREVQARKTRLMTEYGPSEVVDVSISLYKGKVYNVSPVSRRVQDNIHLAEGMLTGSIRFQTIWTGKKDRLALRASLSLDGI